jgi:hypothetical protein
MKTEQVAERWRGEYRKNAESFAIKYDSPMICRLIEELSAAEQERGRLRDALRRVRENKFEADKIICVVDAALDAGKEQP